MLFCRGDTYKQVQVHAQRVSSSGSFCAGRSYQEHAESFSHDAVEEVEGRVSRHHEEVGQEEELSAAVVQQGVVLTAEQRLVGILGSKASVSAEQQPQQTGLGAISAGLTLLSPLCAVWGTRMGPSSSAGLRMAPLWPSVKMVFLLFSDGFEKKPAAERQGANAPVRRRGRRVRW